MKFEPQCKTIGDLYGEMSRVYKMCEGTEARPEDGWKIYGNLRHHAPSLNTNPTAYEFSIGIVEGKHVFRGDTLYCRDFSFYVTENREGKLYGIDCASHAIAQVSANKCTLNPPKQEPTIPEGFTKWEGGEWTGHPNDMVEIMLRCGKVHTEVRHADNCRWSHGTGIFAFDIIAYKITKKYQPETVMVELRVDDVTLIIKYKSDEDGVMIGVSRQAVCELLTPAPKQEGTPE